MATFQTADVILTQAQAELGLTQTSVADTDNQTVRLVALLGKAGRELARLDWGSLTIRYSFSPGTTSPYSLPADFRAMVPQTGWDTSQTWPLLGPLTEQQWEAIKARNVTPAVGTPFRTWQNKLWLYPDTSFPAGHTVSFEYRSAYWIDHGATGSPNAELITAGADTLWFDFPLLVAALKVAWKRETGFDATSAQEDFDVALKAAQDDDADAPILTLNGGRRSFLLGPANLPDGNWG